MRVALPRVFSFIRCWDLSVRLEGYPIACFIIYKSGGPSVRLDGHLAVEVVQGLTCWS